MRSFYWLFLFLLTLDKSPRYQWQYLSGNIAFGIYIYSMCRLQTSCSTNLAQILCDHFMPWDRYSFVFEKVSDSW